MTNLKLYIKMQSNNSSNMNKSSKNKTESQKEKKLRQRQNRNVGARTILVPGPGYTEVPKTVKRSQQYSMSTPGRAFVRNYLNPCGEKEGTESGIPDGSSTLAAIKHSRADPMISAPSGLLGLLTDESDWFLGIIIPPWVDDTAYLFAANFEPTLTSSLTSLFEQAPVYPTWQATDTTPALATTVWYCRITSPGLPTGLGTNEDDTSVCYASEFRYTKRGITTHLVSDANHDRGMITAGQWFCKPQPDVVHVKSTVFTGASDAAVVTDVSTTVITGVSFCWSFLVGEIVPTKMSGSNERTYNGEAREGCYMPVYRSGEDYSYHPYSKRRTQVLALLDDEANSTSAISSISTSLAAKVVDPSQNVAAIWYRGISTLSSVQIKGRYTIQAVVQPGSPWAADAQVGPNKDAMALEVASVIQNELPQAYPACYNDWSFLGDMVKKLVSNVPVVGGLLSGLVDPAGKAIGRLLGI
jgi:hypothetical protein